MMNKMTSLVNIKKRQLKQFKIIKAWKMFQIKATSYNDKQNIL